MKIPPVVVGVCIGGLYSLWCRTLRYTQIDREQCDALSCAGQSLVFASWHDEIFCFPYKRNNWRIAAIVSRSGDGEYVARLLASQGICSFRGSSSRGGVAALMGAGKAIRDEGMHAFVTVDGPRGPRHEIKNGVFALAHRAGAYIVPIRAVYSRAKIFGSWDRFQLPYPFSAVTIIFDDPYRIDAPELTEEVLQEERVRLKEKLDMLLLKRKDI